MNLKIQHGAGEQFRREQKVEKEECRAVHKEDRLERFEWFQVFNFERKKRVKKSNFKSELTKRDDLGQLSNADVRDILIRNEDFIHLILSEDLKED